VRVAIVTESFLPAVNGVTNSVCRVLEHLERTGHEALVVAPSSGPTAHGRFRVERMPSMSLPGYRSFAVGLPDDRLTAVLRDFRPDVVHLAAPLVLGAAAGDAARKLDVPSVAVYQTDLAGFISRYHAPGLAWLAWRALRRIHNNADLTLAPSTLAAWDLAHHGVRDVAIWARGVDSLRFHPSHRSALVRRRLAPNGEVLVGYVGRLAREKRVELLARLTDAPGIRLVIVGDGPQRGRLERRLPNASFLGFQTGDALSQVVASLDLFVHTGADETFCQAVQEALAAGVPVLAAGAGGPLDLVHHGVNGWLWPPDRPDVLGPAVQALVDDPGRRAVMGRAARRSVEARTWSRVGDELLAHYRGVTGSAEASGRAA
jgi:phosphatidylinositol alpha 1,6-mannosyltransferase